MKTNVNFRGLCKKTSITALILMSFTSPVLAQDTFNVKIKYKSSKSMEASYASMAKQAKKYCGREARRISDRISPRRQEYMYIRQCVDQVMDKVIAEINDKKLTAYHMATQSYPKLDALNTSTR